MSKVIEGEFRVVNPLPRMFAMNGVFPPVGTVVGPSPATLDFMAVAEITDTGVRLRHAGMHDAKAIAERIRETGPQSITELEMIQWVRTVFGRFRQIA